MAKKKSKKKRFARPGRPPRKVRPEDPVKALIFDLEKCSDEMEDVSNLLGIDEQDQKKILSILEGLRLCTITR